MKKVKTLAARGKYGIIQLTKINNDKIKLETTIESDGKIFTDFQMFSYESLKVLKKLIENFLKEE